MSFNPDPAAIAERQQVPRFASFLSQRDLSLSIPVNFVTHPGVSLRAACFGHGRYEDTAAAKCISNLLATGFRRLEIDLYWDVSRAHWSLCPVELGGSGVALIPSTTPATTPLRTATSLRTNPLTPRATPAATQDAVFDHQVLEQRQTSSDAASSTTTTTVNANPITTSAASIAPFSTPAVNGTTNLIRLGPYSCTTGTDLGLLTTVISGYLQESDFRFNATTLTITINLHAAAPSSDPTGSALQPNPVDLPGATSLLSSMVATDASVFLYTPGELLIERANWNSTGSWFTTLDEKQLDSSFFQVNVANGQYSTPDGWPTENYVALQRAKRILVGFGEIDPQMSGYDTSSDEALFFPSNYLKTPRLVTTTNQGNITSGCFFDSGKSSVASVNSSWAITVIGNETAPTGAGLASILDQASNLTYCGISPILNSTLNNVTADQDSAPYTAFVGKTVWSWAPGQPANTSSLGLGEYHCAALNSTSGFWQASDCGEARYAACRIADGPYAWRISNADSAYDRVDLTCQDQTRFDVPRTALENTYLLSAFRTWQAKQSNNNGAGELLWLDFNDLDVTTCWVIGQNATCPYAAPVSTGTRQVIVPVVGGIVVFVLAALTVLVKCAGNRQRSKRRRKRGGDGWDYEGVPS